MLHPCSLGLIFVLALCVFLSGYGYKLSLYHARRHSEARVPVAKLWIESKSARALQLPARAYAFGVPDLDWSRHEPLPLRELGRTTIPVAPRSLSLALESLLPSRAPPAPYSSGFLQG